MNIIIALLQRWYDAQVMQRAVEKEAEDREQIQEEQWLVWEEKNIP